MHYFKCSYIPSETEQSLSCNYIENKAKDVTFYRFMWQREQTFYFKYCIINEADCDTLNENMEQRS